ncbi:AAA family ATPase [Hippea alviniae]|uniref:AAA family ATPase n=1 Tax=Hippea alviniae TaxID=1279027 RepID=UPI0003B4DF71|nr:AAA family ATPase [Hippea alviniae]
MITRIIVNNFKNFDLLKADFERINIIKGRNGAGKTNLLEAVFISLNGHPFIRSFKPIQKDLKKPAIITAVIDNNTVLVRFDEKGKSLKLNSKQTTVVNLKKMFPCIDYSINSFISLKSKDYLFSLIDRGIYAKNNKIIDKLVKYSKLQRIKRNILKENSDDKALNILNEEIHTLTAEISGLREELVKEIEKSVYNCYNEFYNQELKIEYEIVNLGKNIFEKEKQKRRILFSLKKDNFNIYLNGRKIQFSSVGERKIALLCIVLSIVKVYNELNNMPVFLIDDLEGDLDRERQKKAFETITELPNQILLTTLEAFEGYNTIDLGGLKQSG